MIKNILKYLSYVCLLLSISLVKAQLPYTQNGFCFDAPIQANSTFSNTQTKNLITRDLNGDGRKDIIVTNGGSFAGAILCYSLNASGNIVLASTTNVNFGLSTSFVQQAISAGDFDNDSFVDLIFTTTDSIYIYRNSGNFVFSKVNSIQIPTQYQPKNHYLETAKINNDGFDDFYFISEKSTGIGIDVLSYRLSSSYNFSLDAIQTIFKSYTYSTSLTGNLDVNIGNLDGDPNSTKDVMFTLNSIPDSVYFLQNNSVTTISNTVVRVKVNAVNGASITSSEIEDLDLDGKLDFIFTLTPGPLTNSFCVIQGSSSFNLNSNLNVVFSTGGLRMNAFKIGDVTGDGKLDFCGLGTYSLTSNITYLNIYSGTGISTYFNPLPSIIHPLSVFNTYKTDEMQVVDIENNGTKDIIFKPRGSNSDRTYLIPNFTYTVDVSPKTISICPGNTVSLKASSSAPSTNYIWNNAQTNTFLSNGESYIANVSGSYAVHLSYPMYSTGSNCKLFMDTVIISNSTPPTISISQSPAPSCIGKPVQLTASGVETYTWLNTAGNIINNINTYSTNALPNSTLTIKGTDSKGCDGNSQFIISVFPPPTTGILASDSVICAGNSVTLSLSSAQSFSWSTNSNSPYIIVSPNSNSTYSLTYEGLNGCIYNSFIAIKMDLNCEKNIIYNSITPNNDGINDAFFIENIERFTNNNVSIYNRWGQNIIYINNYNNINNNWPKKEDALKLASTTYFYIINFGNGNLQKGWIEVLKD